MKTCNRSAILIAALFLLALLAGCGSTSSSNTVPTVEQAFYAHSVVFSNNSTLLTAGYNEFGQLGNGTLTSPFALVGTPPTLGRVHGYAAGANHTLAFGSSNPAFGNSSTVWAWGSNLHGRLGINNNKQYEKAATTGNDAFTKFPIKFVLPNTVVSLATGWNHSLAVAGQNRSVLSWGANNFGQLGNGASTNLDDRPFYGYVVFQDKTPLDRVQQVAAGGSHSLALTEDGKVYSWGYNEFGQLGRATITPETPKAVFSFIPAEVVFPPEATGKKVVQIAAAGSFSAARMDDGTVWTWGYNVYGQCGKKPAVSITPTPAGNVTTSTQYLVEPTQVKFPDGTAFYASKISLGSMHVLALSTTGELWSWGWNEKAQLGLSDYQRDPSTNLPVLNAFGQPTVVNNTSLFQFTPQKVTNVGLVAGISDAKATDIYAFGTVSFARINGTWYGWGDNSFGQLGQTIPTNRIPLIFTPVEFKPLNGA